MEALRAALSGFYRPGEPERLRAGVKPVDPGPDWAAYLETLLRAAAPPAADLTGGVR